MLTAQVTLRYPDALAGIVREHLAEGQSAGFRLLQSTLTVTDVSYAR